MDARIPSLTYADLLSTWIDESGLTLREIAERCTVDGHPITYSYISKVRSGKLPAPSPEVSGSLAKVLGHDPGPLRLLSNIERLDQQTRGLFWAMLSLVIDPDNPVASELQADRRRMIPFILTQLSKYGWRGDVPEQDLHGLLRRLVGVLAGRAGMPRDIVALSIFEHIPTAEDVEFSQMVVNARNIVVSSKAAAGADYAFEVQQDMPEVEAHAGDLLLIRQGIEAIESGQTVLVRFGDEMASRRYYQVRDGYRLEPAAPAGDHPTQILGVIRGLYRRFE